MSSTPLYASGQERMHRVLSGHIERKAVPGMVGLISHRDAVHVETLGTMAFDAPSPMRSDTIFRIASLTKLVTAVAAMILVEDCVLGLEDAIDSWLPELADRSVLRDISAELTDTVPANRPITVRDLLTYRMGFGSVMAAPDTYPIQKLIREYRIGGDGPVLPTSAFPMDEWLQKLGSLPLLAQPGEKWMYHVSGDVLGALIARASGQSLGTFMRERIFDPLGMKDTGFVVPPDKLDRLPGFYTNNPETHVREFFDDPNNSAWRSEPPFESGGGGLVSTMDDFFVFCRMLLNKGKHDQAQILSRASVELMTTDHLTPENRAGADIFFGNYSSWGLGMAIDIRREEIYQMPGRFGWAGGFGTMAYIDPVQEVIGILFTQCMIDSPESPKVFTDFYTLAYAALP